MGAWGPGIYQNDTSEDVKCYFMDQLHQGKNAREITDALMESYKEIRDDKQEQQDFWCALADVQWKMGRLLPDVKANAMLHLNEEELLLDWEYSSDRNKRNRKKTLLELRERLSTPQPEEKKVSRYRLYHCPWKIGDVFALPLGDGIKSELSLCGQYLLIEKIETKKWHPGHDIPVVYLKITQKKSIPKTKEEYETLDYVKIEEIRVRNLPPADDNEPELVRNMRCSLDERGILNAFRIALITTSKRVIPKELQYIGNFQELQHPHKEYIPFWEESILSLFWNELAEKASDFIAQGGAGAVRRTVDGVVSSINPNA